MSSLEMRRVSKGRSYLELARVSNLPTVLSNAVGAGALAATLDAAVVGIVAAAMGLFYTAGMFLNDYCDRHRDRLERPERPIPRGDVSPAEALGWTAVMFTVGLGLLALTGTFWWGAVLVALIVLYDVWHKTNPLSPLLMAGTRVCIYLITGAALQVAFADAALWGGMLGCYVVGLTQLAKLESRGALTWWPLALLYVPAVTAVVLHPGLWTGTAAALFTFWVTVNVRKSLKGKQHLGQVVGNLIAGMCLLDAMVAAQAGRPEIFLLCLVLFPLTCFWQRYVQGT